MKLLLLTIFALGGCRAAFALKCGQMNGTSVRSFGGTDIESPSAPFVASILVNSKYRCGGTIIAKRAVLTLASCIATEDPKLIRIKAGQGELSKMRELLIEEVVIHPGYHSLSAYDDVAIIVLAEDLTFGESTNKICLPQFDRTQVGERISVASFGARKPDFGSVGGPVQYTTSEHLHRVEVRVSATSGPLLFTDNSKHAYLCQYDTGAGAYRFRSPNQVELVATVWKPSDCSRKEYTEQSSALIKTSSFWPWAMQVINDLP